MRFTRFSAKAFLFLGSETKVLQRFWQEWFPGSVQQVVNHRHNFYIVPVGNCHQVANILVGKLSKFFDGGWVGGADSEHEQCG